MPFGVLDTCQNLTEGAKLPLYITCSEGLRDVISRNISKFKDIFSYIHSLEREFFFASNILAHISSCLLQATELQQKLTILAPP